MKNKYLILLASVIIVLVAGILCWMVGGLPWVLAFLTGMAGIKIADIVVPGISTVEDAKEESTLDDINYISKKITEIRPAMTPIDTIMRSVNDNQKIDTETYEYYKVGTKGVYDTVSTAYTRTDDGEEVAALVVSNTDNIWSVDDTIYVPGVTGRDDKGLMLLVNKVTRATSTLSVQAVNGPDGLNTKVGKRVVPTIAAGTKIYRMGKAGSELDAQTTPYTMLPEKDFNYCQIFMAQVEESNYQKMRKKEVEWNFSDLERLNVYDMRMTEEASFLWGYRHKVFDLEGNDWKYTTGGMWRDVTKSLEYGTGGTNRTISKTQYINWAKQIFTGNSGSEKRLMFYGGQLGASLHEIEEWQKQLQATSTEVVFGLTFKKIVTNFGILLAYYHPLFSLYGYDDYGLVLDINNVEKRSNKLMSIDELKLKESGQRNTTGNFISESSCVVARYIDTHAIISPAA